jgi:hypothetical protein
MNDGEPAPKAGRSQRKTIPVRRREKQHVFTLFMLGFVMLAGVTGRMVQTVFRPSRGMVGLMAGLLLVLLLSGLVVPIMLTRRLRARLAESDWRRCLHCFFDLRGLPAHGMCPECGEAYEIDKVREEWMKEVGTRRGQQPG